MPATNAPGGGSFDDVIRAQHDRLWECQATTTARLLPQALRENLLSEDRFADGKFDATPAGSNCHSWPIHDQGGSAR
jgi:hypothetical protein